MNRMTLASIMTLCVIACDPKASSDATTKNTVKESGALAARGDAPPADANAAPARFNGLSDCLSSCERADVIPTNRATCRLNCDSAYGAHADGKQPGDDVIGRAADCFRRCAVAPGAADTCTEGCKAVAAGAASPPAADVLEQLRTCVSTCPTSDVRPTDRETCELNCAQAARVASTPPPGNPSPPRSP